MSTLCKVKTIRISQSFSTTPSIDDYRSLQPMGVWKEKSTVEGMGDAEDLHSVGTVDAAEGIHNTPNIRFYGNQRTGSHSNLGAGPSSEAGGQEEGQEGTNSLTRQASWFKQVADRHGDESARTGKTVYGVKWVDDKDSNGCNCCGILFTKIHRRHHCRCCGHLVCGSCSPSRIMVSDDYTTSRVCNDCLMSEKLGAQIERASTSRASIQAAIEEEKAAKAAEAARIQAEKDAAKAAAAVEKAKLKEAADAEKAKIKEEKAAEKAKAKEEKAAVKAKAKEEKAAVKAKAKEEKAVAKAKAKEEKEAAKAKAKAEKEAEKAGAGPEGASCSNCQSPLDAEEE